MKTFTCLDCPDRHPKCHASCEKYLAEKAKYEADKAEHKKDRDSQDYFSSRYSKQQAIGALRRKRLSGHKKVRLLGSKN
jgi:hypothetical protein